jgi:hypothetical protein
MSARPKGPKKDGPQQECETNVPSIAVLDELNIELILIRKLLTKFTNIFKMVNELNGILRILR